MFPGIFTMLDSCQQCSLESHKERQHYKAPEHQREVEHQTVPPVRLIENKFGSVRTGKIDRCRHCEDRQRNEPCSPERERAPQLEQFHADRSGYIFHRATSAGSETGAILWSLVSSRNMSSSDGWTALISYSLSPARTSVAARRGTFSRSPTSARTALSSSRTSAQPASFNRAFAVAGLSTS